MGRRGHSGQGSHKDCNCARYVGKFDEATWNLFASLGLTPSYLREQNRGMAAVEQKISYKRELRPGDLVTVRSTVLEVKDRVIRISHEMRGQETDEVAATTELTAVHLDTLTRRAIAFAPEILARAREAVAG